MLFILAACFPVLAGMSLSALAPAYPEGPDVLPASPVDATQEPKPASKAKAVVAMVASAAVFATLATFAMKPNAVSTTRPTSLLPRVPLLPG